MPPDRTKGNVVGELALQTKPLQTNSTVLNRFTRDFRPYSDYTETVSFRANCLFLWQIVIYRANFSAPQ